MLKPAPRWFVRGGGWPGRCERSKRGTDDGVNGCSRCDPKIRATPKSALGRFVQRDPLGYVDGMSVYAYLSAQVLSFNDPFGLYRLNFVGQEGHFDAGSYWSCSDEQRIRDTLDLIEERLPELLREIDDELLGLSNCVWNQVKDDVQKIKDLLNAMKSGLEGGEWLNLRQENFGSSELERDTFAKAKNATWLVRRSIQFNNNESSGRTVGNSDQRRLGRDVFHELTHVENPDTHDGEGDDPWLNSHNIDDMFGGDFKRFFPYANAVKLAKVCCEENASGDE